MSEKAKATHNAFCDYEIKKAKSLQIRTERKSSGIRTSGLSREMLAMELASLF